MKRNRKKIATVILIILSTIVISFTVDAHSGRTDANGGHRDNKNKSGLGSYHYHCGGHPAHLHTNGVCPYSSGSSSKSKSTSTSSSSKSATPTSSSVNKGNTSNSSTKTTNEKPSNVEVTEIQINENIEELEVGTNKTLTVTITPNNATNKNVTWKSSDENIATVGATGEIVTKKSGVVTITATSSNGKTSEKKLNVKDVSKAENIVMANNSANNQTTNTNSITEVNNDDSDAIKGAITLGLLGGGGYWGYKKYKTKKN